MRNETVWITLPEQEKISLQHVINLIENRNLSSFSVDQLIEKLENHEATSWIEILTRYNAIPSIRNINTTEMLDRTKSVRNKFRACGYPELENKEFLPRELLSLIILCYSNPNLIGPKLCAALNNNDKNNIKKEILENSAYVRAQNRVVPWASNLRLINFALYSSDLCVRLPDTVLSRIRAGAVARNINLIESDQSNSNCSVPYANNSYSIGVENRQIIGEIAPALSYKSSQLIDGDGATAVYSNANAVHMPKALMAGLVGFHVLRNFPVIAPVVRNVNKSVTNGFYNVTRFFNINSQSTINESNKQKMLNHQQSLLNETSSGETATISALAPISK